MVQICTHTLPDERAMLTSIAGAITHKSCKWGKPFLLTTCFVKIVLALQFKSVFSSVNYL